MAIKKSGKPTGETDAAAGRRAERMPPRDDLVRHLMDRDERMWLRLTERDAILQDQIVQLFARLVDSTGHDDVLINGFEAIASQIGAQSAPLRALGRQYKPLGEEQDRALALIQRALARHEFALDKDPDARGVRTKATAE
jgi:hypothetical protein